VAVEVGNMAMAAADNFVDLAGGDARTSPTADAVAAGDPTGLDHAPEDIDGELRPPDAPTVGADEP
jgi:hypothetical protein